MQKDDWQVLKGGKAFVLKYDTFPGNIMKAKAKENTKLHTNQIYLTVWSTCKFSKHTISIILEIIIWKIISYAIYV